MDSQQLILRRKRSTYQFLSVPCQKLFLVCLFVSGHVGAHVEFYVVDHFFNLIKFILVLPPISGPSCDFGVAKIIKFSSPRIVESGLPSRTSAQIGEPMGFSPFFLKRQFTHTPRFFLFPTVAERNY